MAKHEGAGSSPHTRGARARRRRQSLLLRIIPAYAGSTSIRDSVPAEDPDHPRIRGEHPIAAKPDNLVMGSSPHTRGAPSFGFRFDLGGWDHPRIRGEHFVLAASHPPHEGSSPHTRGALQGAAGADGRGRIIPAYAGSTDLFEVYLESHGDHPRIRGEHRSRTGRCHRTSGIIPAYAGSTRLRSCRRRWRGGSSPHTRGALVCRRCRRCAARIIPAYAGSTRWSTAYGKNCPDHPRIRGEHMVSTARALDRGGSSPHTRGAPPRPGHKAAVPGIIPAYAGSTLSLP